MNKIKETLKKHTITFWLLNLYLILMIFIPKTYSYVFGLPFRLLLTAILILVIFYEYKKDKLKFNNHKSRLIYILLFIFTLAIIPSLIVSKDIITSLYTYIKFMSAFVMFILIYRIKFEDDEYKILLKNLIICLAVISIIGLIQYIFNIDLMVKNSGIYYYPGAKGRLEITFFNACYYGIFINITYGFVLYAIYKNKNKKFNIPLILLAVLFFINLILTFTRSAIIIFIWLFITIACLFTRFKPNFKLIITIILLIASSLIIPGSKPLFTKTFNDALKMANKIAYFLPININIEDDEYVEYDENSEFIDYSLQHREAFSRIAKRIAKDNLYTGVGFGTYINYMNSRDFDLKYPEYDIAKIHPHSSVILTYAETGIFGLISVVLIYILLVLMSVRIFIKSFRSNNEVFRVSVVALTMALGFMLVNIMSENAAYDTQINYLFMLMYGMTLSYCYKNMPKKVLFIASTGGHLSELLQLKPLFNKYDNSLITEKTKSTIDLKEKYKNVNYLVYGTREHKFTYPFKFMYNCIKSLILYIKINPNVIVTTGTHTAVPMCYIGKLLGSKIIFIETFANSETKTASGKLVYPIADTFIVQWESMLKLYPKAIYGGWIY